MTASSDLINGEASSPYEYVKSAAQGAVIGAVCGAIFGPVAGIGGGAVIPLTGGQTTVGLGSAIFMGGSSGYIDYSLRELWDGRTPDGGKALESFAFGAALGGAFSVGASWLAKGAERVNGALKRGASSRVEGMGKPIPNLNSKASSQVINLKNVEDAARQYASSLRDGILNGAIKKTTGGKIDAKVLTVAVDKKTGEMFYGISGSKNNPTRLNETHPDLQQIIDHKGVSETNYPLDNCGEFNAINHALFNGNQITDLKLYTINIKSGEFKEMCLNCDSMYSKLVEIIK